MIPEKTHSSVFWEHVFRYAFACEKVKNLNVLDIASGEGYGSYALSKVAKGVIGVDISSVAVDHAKKNTVSITGLEAQIQFPSNHLLWMLWFLLKL